jgi:hypothetical protein
MATYDSPRSEVVTNLQDTVGGFLANQILAALDKNGAEPGANVDIVTDWAPGQTVPAGTDLLIAAPGSVVGEITIPSDVSALLLTGPLGVQATFNVTSDVGVYLTEAQDIITINLPAAPGEGGEPVEATFDGGSGFDIGLVEGSIDDYEVQYDNGVLTLVSSDGHTLSLHDLEYVKFADGGVIVNLDTELDVSSATLYEVILGRSADEGGLQFFTGRETTDELIQSADVMLRSDEFTSKFGSVDSLSDEQFLDILYESAFGREADEGGQEFWLEQLAGGMSKAVVAVNFAVSAESDTTFEGLINLEKEPEVPTA